MTIKEFYDSIDSDYNEVFSRFNSDKMITKYVLKFQTLKDADYLLEAIEKKDWEKAFEFSHNFKGNCLNLGFSHLCKSSSDICELVRGGNLKGDIEPLAEQFKKDFNFLIDCIKKYEESIQ